MQPGDLSGIGALGGGRDAAAGAVGIIVAGCPVDEAVAREAYATQVLQPLLVALAHEAMQAMPSRLAAFLVAWLLEQLQAPPNILDSVQVWLQSSSASSAKDLAGGDGGAHQLLDPPDGASWRDPSSSRNPSSPQARTRTRIPQVSRGEAISLIRNVPLFQDLSEQDVEDLAAVAEVCCFGADSEIVRQGCHHEALHLIVSGEGCVSVPQVVGTLRRGDSFGERALVRRHLAAAQTISVPGGDGSELVTLAIMSDKITRLNLMSRLLPERRACSSAMAPPFSRDAEHGRLSDGEPPIAISSSRSRGPTSPEDRTLIEQAIQANVHFTEWLQLSQSQVEAMVQLMYLATAEVGEEVVKKGELGDRFYIVCDGVLEVHTGDTQTENAVRVKLRSGDSFGELALLYNCPRKATVRAQRRCGLWVLERKDFRAVMRLKSEARICEYVELIDSVDLLRQHLSTSDKRVLADALEEVFHVQGEEVVTQSHPGNSFFIVFQGCCEVRVNGEIRSFLQKGNFFGEQALLSKEPQAATVTVISATAVLLGLDCDSFHLLLGDAMTVAATTPGEDTRRRRRRCSTAELIGRLLVSMPGTEKPKVPWESLEELGVLGMGSFGRVTLQRDRSSGDLYALKALSKGYIKSKQLEQHVVNERRAMEMLESEFLVRLRCTYRCPQYVYFLLEPALGGELYDAYVQNEHLFGSAEHARFYVVCASLGLQHLHDRRIIYRDLKLENALLYSNGYACLTDLGLAKVVIGKTYTVCGTADYLAPEILRQTGHNRAVDWWALGIMLFIMIAGRAPFDAEDVMQIYRNIVKGFKRETFPDNFSEDLVDLILTLCRKKPERRLPMSPGGMGNIQAHAWFGSYPWDAVRDRTLPAPYQPPQRVFEDSSAAGRKSSKKSAEFMVNDPTTDNGWDADF